MPVTFPCHCGKTLKVADEHAGKRVRCPACNGAVAVPAAEKSFEVVDEVTPPVPQAPIARAKPVVAKAIPVKSTAPSSDDFEVVDDDEDDLPPKKSRKKWDDDDGDELPRSKKSRRAVARDDEDETDDEEDDRPTRKSKRGKSRRKKSKPAADNSGKRMLYIVGGVLMIIAGGALAYFITDVDTSSRSASRGVGKLFILGIVIALGGIGAIFNGITGNVGGEEEKSENDDEDDDDDR